MTDDTGTTEAAAALALIEAAFARRPPPDVMTDSKQLSDREYAEVMFFQGMRWQDVSYDQVEQYSDAVFWFAPEAFCYYLPGFLASGIRENRTHANACDALIGMLDRSPEPAYWDDFFAPRWTLLNVAEIDAVAAWVRWLRAVEPGSFYCNTYQRALGTLVLLKDRRSRT